MKILRYAILYATVSLYFASGLNAQKHADFKPFTIELKKRFYQNAVSGNHAFVFFDERYDTTRMGFFEGDRTVFYFRFPDAASAYLSNKYNYQDEHYPDTLFIGIRKLWLSEITISGSLLRAILLSPMTTMGYCRVTCNFYKRNGNDLFLVHQYDSINSKKGYLGNIDDELMGNGLYSLMQVADSIGSIRGIPVNAIKRSDMDAVRKKPAILGTDKINDGIYLTFNDFLDNKPADIQFEYVVSKKRDSISLSEMRADDSVFTKKCWGFCKKGIPYMRINNDFSLLSKIQNTFELNSQQTIRLKYKKASSVFWTAFNIAHDLAGPFPEFVVFDIPLSKPTDTIRGIGFYKLDMETGEIY